MVVHVYLSSLSVGLRTSHITYDSSLHTPYTRHLSPRSTPCSTTIHDCNDSYGTVPSDTNDTEDYELAPALSPRLTLSISCWPRAP